MPLYEYQCQACGHRFEVIQKFSDAPPSECPKCGGAVEKLVSSPAIQFKGSGFYLTDYGRGGKSDTAPAKDGKAECRREGREGGPKSRQGRQGRAGRQGRQGRPRAGKSDAAPSSGSSGESSGAKTGDSKPAAPATPKSD